jgi:hypothetical protein
MENVTYQVWVGDTLLISDIDKKVAKEVYDKTPSGKAKAPSKRRCFIKCETIEKD